MKAGEMFKGYQDMRQECIVLEFQIRQFEGIVKRHITAEPDVRL